MNYPYSKPVISKDQNICRFGKQLSLRTVERNKESGCDACYFKQNNVDCDSSMPCFNSERADMRDITWEQVK